LGEAFGVEKQVEKYFIQHIFSKNAGKIELICYYLPISNWSKEAVFLMSFGRLQKVSEIPFVCRVVHQQSK